MRTGWGRYWVSFLSFFNFCKLSGIMSSGGTPKKYWIKAYIKGWSFEIENIYAIVSFPAKNLKKIKQICGNEQENCYLLLEIDDGSFIALSIDRNGNCVKTKIKDQCWTDKRYVYIKLKVKQNDLAIDSIRAGFKEKVRLFVGHCEETQSLNDITNICELCVYGIEKLYKHGS